MGRLLERLTAVHGPLLAACLAIMVAADGEFVRFLTGRKSAAVADVRQRSNLKTVPQQNACIVRRTQRFKVPAQSLLVLQSLDLTGSRHCYQLKRTPAERPTDLASSIVENGVDGQFRTISLPNSTCAPAGLLSGRFPERPNSNLASNEVTGDSCREAFDSECRDGELTAAQMQTGADSVPRQRRFLLPCFTQLGVSETLALCRHVFSGQAVEVYINDQMLTQCVRLIEVCEFLEQELQRRRGSLRNEVESHLGEIEDIDGNGLLTIVLTRLDHRKKDVAFTDFIPVMGCVRETDFLSPEDCGSTSGDILYLDIEGLDRNGRRSLLSHELSHAAVHSQQLRRFSRGQQKLMLPQWFHEALAHWVEHQTAGPGRGYAGRLQQFCRQPQLSPVVQHPFTDWNAARGGSRAAGLLFLERSFAAHQSLRDLLNCSDNFDELLQALLGTSFATGLSEWGPAMALELWTSRKADIPQLPRFEDDATAGRESRISGVLHGTSMAVWRSPEIDLELEIEHTREASLLVTVILPPHQRN